MTAIRLLLSVLLVGCAGGPSFRAGRVELVSSERVEPHALREIEGADCTAYLWPFGRVRQIDTRHALESALRSAGLPPDEPLYDVRAEEIGGPETCVRVRAYVRR